MSTPQTPKRGQRDLGLHKFLVWALLVALLLFGPMYRDQLEIRIGYLVLLPTLLWYGLGFAWRRWQPDEVTEERVRRSVAGMLAGILLVGAIWFASWGDVGLGAVCAFLGYYAFRYSAKLD